MLLAGTPSIRDVITFPKEILGVPVDVVEASTLRPGDADIVADAVALESA
jgi:hypothetical protein